MIHRAGARRPVFAIVALVALLALIVTYLKRVPADGGAPTRFRTIDEYRAQQGGKLVHQVVVIGLDGATWSIIDSLIASGDLPTFRRLKEEGVYGTLRSVDCYFTPPAWTTMLSGYLPERTGVYTFGNWSGKGNVFQTVSALDVAVPQVWDVASAAGRRVAVANVPVTHPARPVNGVMVTGVLTPLEVEDGLPGSVQAVKVFQGSFDRDLDQRAVGTRVTARWTVGGSTVAVVLYDTIDDGEAAFDTAALKVLPRKRGGVPIPRTTEVYRMPINRFGGWIRVDGRQNGERDRKLTCAVKIDYSMGAFQGMTLTTTPLMRLPTDPDMRLTYPPEFAGEIERRFGHYIHTAGFMAEIAPFATEEMASFASYLYDYDDWDFFMYMFPTPDNIQHHEGLSDRTREVYMTIDRFLAELLERLPEDATLVLASDHGFSHFDYVVVVNNFLRDLGLLEPKGRQIEFDTSLVFHDRWCIYFNDSLLTREELERRGVPIAEGETPRRALVNYLIEEAKHVRMDPDSTRTFPLELVEVPEDGAGTPPDMVVIGSYSDYFVEGSDLRIFDPRVVREAPQRQSWYHDRNGIYLFWGNRIRRGMDGGVVNIEDIAPTILYLSELPLARDLDGDVVEQAIRPEFLAKLPHMTLDEYQDLKPAVELTQDELQSLEDKLRTLGYIR